MGFMLLRIFFRLPRLFESSLFQFLFEVSGNAAQSRNNNVHLGELLHEWSDRESTRCQSKPSRLKNSSDLMT